MNPCAARTRLHTLEDNLLIAILDVICGADRGPAVEPFTCRKHAWLETFLELPNGIPSHDHFGHGFARLDPAQLKVCFTRWVPSLAATLRN